MTGMVKEEILIRQRELGYFIENGNLVFEFLLLDRNEFLIDSKVFSYWSVDMRQQQLELQAGSVAYTICQVPIILQASKKSWIMISLADGSTQKIDGHILDPDNSMHIFHRDGFVHHLTVCLVR